MSNRLSRRGFLKMSGAAASLAVLAACTAPAGAPAAGGETASDAPAAAAVALVWDTFRAPGTGWNEERIETFQEMQPGVTIEFRPLTGSTQQDNYGKMYAMYAAGDLGDIWPSIPPTSTSGAPSTRASSCPLDDLVEANGSDLSQWFEHFMVAATLPGQPVRSAQLGLGRLRHAGHQCRALRGGRHRTARSDRPRHLHGDHRRMGAPASTKKTSALALASTTARLGR